jgi:hypothetical protein
VAISVAVVPPPPTPSNLRGERDEDMPNQVSVNTGVQPETPTTNLSPLELALGPEVVLNSVALRVLEDYQLSNGDGLLHHISCPCCG